MNSLSTLLFSEQMSADVLKYSIIAGGTCLISVASYFLFRYIRSHCCREGERTDLFNQRTITTYGATEGDIRHAEVIHISNAYTAQKEFPFSGQGESFEDLSFSDDEIMMGQSKK